MVTETSNEFEMILQPLDIMINLVFDNHIQPSMDELYLKYKEDLIKTKSANEDIKTVINNSSKQSLSLLSKRYRRRLLQFYSQDGLAYYIYVRVNRLTINLLEELIEQ